MSTASNRRYWRTQAERYKRERDEARAEILRLRTCWMIEVSPSYEPGEWKHRCGACRMATIMGSVDPQPERMYHRPSCFVVTWEVEQ